MSVYIVGAGPGDVELLTLKAYKVIMDADVILYDDLIGEDILELLKKTKAELISVGKRSGKHKKKQEEINKMLVEYAKQGKKVVRLKGGDPFVFGRGGEEIEFLAENGIEFKVIPGITSAIAVPAYAGIPVTHRRCDPALIFITGREARERLKWDALAKLNATIIVLMGVKNLEKICRRLIENGKNPNTPVAIIQEGTTANQRVVVGNLSNIAEIAKKERIEPPAIIVIGDVVKLREKTGKFIKNIHH